MPAKETILVTGATGAQGGSVVRHLLARGTFAVRGLTRNVNSDTARELARFGVAMVAGEMADATSLKRAMEGCHGVFGVTNYWEHFEKEYEHGRNLVDAVEAAGVEHLVYSTLPSAKKISGGTLISPHLDLKAEVEEYARSKNLPATFANVAFYYENFMTFFPPQPSGDGSFSFGFPQGETPLAGVSVGDVGGVVATIFENRDKYLGKVIGVVGDDLTPAEYARMLSEGLGTKIVYKYIPREVFASSGFPGADDLANMFEFNRLYVPNRTADMELSRTLYPGMKRFRDWVAENAESFRALLARR